MTDMPFYREPFTMRQTHVTNQQPAVPDPQQGGQQLVALYPGQGMPQSTYIQYIQDYKWLQAFQQSQKKIARLQNQLERKIWKEEELKQVIRLQGNAYFSIMASGRTVQLTHFIFEKVEHIVYAPFYGRKPQIRIKVSTQEEPSQIDWDDFWNDKKWLVFLEQASRSKIRIYNSVKQIALLLRSIANEKMRDVFVPYFGGWAKTEDGCYRYYTFRSFRTSARGGEPESYEMSHVTLPANVKAATDRFLTRFTPILDKPLRSFCILWQHLSFLQTLLLERGICLRKAPVIQAENPVVQAYLRSVLTVSADGVLNMNGIPDEFAWALASCKDQPCVILPPKFGKNATDNERLLDEALSSGTISLQKTELCPLSTLPVLLCDGGGQSTSYGIPVTAEAACFDLPQCAATAVESSSSADYWSGFLAFTHLYMDKLNRLLEEQMEQALVRSADCEYTMEHAAVLGTMWGVAEFIRLFVRELSLTDNEILDDGWLDYTIALLEESDAQYAAPDGLADSFLNAARRAIRRKEFACYRIGQQLPAFLRGAVYFDEDFVCLDRVAFEQICQAAGCNSAAVKRELSEQGCFAGKTVNRQAYESRISVRYQGSRRQMIRVYKFYRALFETPGEPVLFQEV